MNKKTSDLSKIKTLKCSFPDKCIFTVYSVTHGMLSTHEDGGGHFSEPVGGLPFHMDNRGTPSYGGVTIWDFPGGTPVPISCPIGKHRTQVCKSEFNKICRIKFYQIVTSDVHTSL